MRRYETYKDSGVQWMGEIPSHWELASLGRICTLRTGTTPKCYDSEIGNDTIDWYTPSDFTDSLVLLPSSRRLNKVEFENSGINYFPAKSVLIIGIGGTTGKTSYCQTQCYSNQQITALCPQDKINYVYLTLFLRSIRKNLLDTAPYTTLPILSNKFLSSIKVSLPPLPEQQHIVAFLDEKIAKIDEYIAKKEAEIESLKEWKKAITAHLVKYGITPNVELHETGVFWWPQAPLHWRIVNLGRILKKESRPRLEGAELLVCTNKGSVTKRGESKTGLVADSDEIYQGVKSGDLLIHGMDTWHGAIAVSNLDGMCTPVVHVCTSKQNVRFVSYYMQVMAYSKIFKLISNGVRQNTSDFRSWDKVRKIPIMLPPLDEQNEIVDYIDAATTKADKMIVELSYHVEHMKEYKQRLISDVVTGKINVQPT